MSQRSKRYRNQAQHFIDGRAVTKKDFLSRNDEEMRTAYIRQQYLLENKIFSLGQIRDYEKRRLLSPVRYRGGKYFKKEDVSTLISESSGIL